MGQRLKWRRPCILFSMKFEFTKEWAESVPLEDLLDPSAGRKITERWLLDRGAADDADFTSGSLGSFAFLLEAARQRDRKHRIDSGGNSRA